MKTLEEQRVWKEVIEYFNEFFPNDRKPRSKPDPEKARGHAIVLLGLAQHGAEEYATQRVREALERVQETAELEKDCEVCGGVSKVCSGHFPTTGKIEQELNQLKPEEK